MTYDKMLGAMLGGAVGDALGYAVEFKSYGAIVGMHGPRGITRYELNKACVAEISDDTQMSLFTANALVNGLVSDGLESIGQWAEPRMVEAYLEWHRTQREPYRPGAEAACWLSGVPEMYARRAPGNTCMSALGNIAAGVPVCNNSKGCGGVMRVAPVGLFCAAHGLGDATAMALGCMAARITHQHPLGYLPAGLMAYVVKKIVETGASDKGALIDIVMAGLDMVEDYCGQKGALHAIALRKCSVQAIRLAQDSRMPDIHAVRELGEGWVGDEAWCIALCCVLRHVDSFEDAIVAAVNHSGDSDSTGAIAGNLAGAIHGAASIPAHYVQSLELLPAIQKIASQLAS